MKDVARKFRDARGCDDFTVGVYIPVLDKTVRGPAYHTNARIGKTDENTTASSEWLVILSFSHLSLLLSLIHI